MDRTSGAAPGAPVIHQGSLFKGNPTLLPAAPKVERRLIHRSGKKYPWRIEEPGTVRPLLFVANHVMVGFDPDTPPDWAAIEKFGYAIQAHSSGLAIVSWETPEVEAFSHHHEKISELLPGLVVEKDYIMQKCIWPYGEYRYFFGDQVGHYWMYKQGYTAEGMVIAVVDTGVNLKHPDLAGFIRINSQESADGSDNDNNGFIDDLHGWDFMDNDADPSDMDGHGTAIAAIISGNPENLVGVAGFAPYSEILPIRFMDEEGGATSDGILGIDYARMMGADVINASWGHPSEEDTQLLQQSIERYISEGGIFVVAAGNDGLNLDVSQYSPAGLDIPGMVVVGGLDQNLDRMDSKSNWGGATVDIAAPFTVMVVGLDTIAKEQKTGTSLSTPIVAGMLAFGKKQRPELSAGELVERLYATGQLVPKLAGRVQHPGYPVVYRMFNNTRNKVPAITGHSVMPANVGVGETFVIELEVDAAPGTDTYAVSYGIDSQQLASQNFITGVAGESASEFWCKVWGMAGMTEYGPIRIEPENSIPYPGSPLPDVVELDLLESERRLGGNTIKGRQPIEINWYRNGARATNQSYQGYLELSRDPALAGTYTLRADNLLGSFEHTVVATWEGRIPANETFSLPYEKVFAAGSGLLLQSREGYSLFENGEIIPLPKPDRAPVQVDRSGDWLILTAMYGWIYYAEIGEPWSSLRMVRDGNVFLGSINGNFIFFDKFQFVQADPVNGSTSEISLPGGISDNDSLTAVVHNSEIVLAGSEGVWTYSVPGGWQSRSSPVALSGAAGIVSGGRILFFDGTGILLFSEDNGSNWASRNSTGFPDSADAFEVFLYDSLPSVIADDILYQYQFTSNSWTETFYFNDPTRLPVPSGEALLHKNDYFLNGESSSRVIFISEAVATVEGIYCNDGNDGSYFTRDLEHFTRISGTSDQFQSTCTGTYRLSSDGFYLIDESGQQTRIGEGFSGSGSKLYSWSGQFFVHSTFSWLALNPSSRTWMSQFSENGFVFTGSTYQLGPDYPVVGLPVYPPPSITSVSFRGKTILRDRSKSYTAFLDTRFEDPVRLRDGISRSLPFALWNSGAEWFSDPDFGDFAARSEWEDRIWSPTLGWIHVFPAQAGTAYLHVAGEGWFYCDVRLLPYMYSYDNQSWAQVNL